MEHFASCCLTEPGAGPDAAALTTKAVRHGDRSVLNGARAFVSGGGRSDFYAVMCRTGAEGPEGISALAVPKDMPDLSFGAQERKLGWNSQPKAMVLFDNAGVPAENLVGEEGEGFRIAMTSLDGGRVNIAACPPGRRWKQPWPRFGTASSSAGPWPSSKPCSSGSPAWRQS